MKALKLIVVVLLLFAGGKLAAQNVIVTNNTALTNGTVEFYYYGCPTLSIPFSAFGTRVEPYTCTPPYQVLVHFDDPACVTNPRTMALFPVAMPSTIQYFSCGGGAINFTLNFVGGNWTVNIN